MMKLVSDFIAIAIQAQIKISPWTIISAFVVLGLFKIVFMYLRAKLR